MICIFNWETGKSGMNVSEIMTKKPVTVRRNDMLYTALQKMEQAGCHHLPVMSGANHLIGIITDKDCYMALNIPLVEHDRWHENQQARQLRVKDAMTPAPIIVEPSTSAAEAARYMLVNHISCLPVMRGETLVGIITNSDILLAFIKSEQLKLTLEQNRSASNIEDHQ